MSAWQELVSAAVMGTERQPFSPPRLGGSLGQLLGQLDTPEGALLGTAALLSLYRRAGQQPASLRVSLPDACPADDRPRCSPRAGQHLALMLGGQYTELLPEWLAALDKAGLRVPDSHLPALLQRGHKQAELQPGIVGAVGRRGHWLAAQNPDWAYVAGAGDGGDEAIHTSWRTGSRVERKALLRRLRASDPDRARDLVATTWSEESPEERAAFLEAFGEGLGMADEPFLEAALDDRRKEVRRRAAELLARLPESRLVQRMIERVNPLLGYRRGLLGRGVRLEVSLPDACDTGVLRDGVEPKPPAGSGEKAWWLQQMLGTIPPRHWCARWNASPSALIKAARSGEWGTLLLTAWSAAAGLHRDPEWAEGLLETYLDGAMETAIGDLVDVLPTARREALLTRAVRAYKGPLKTSGRVVALLAAPQRQWSLDLSREVLRAIRHSATQGAVLDWQLPPLLGEIARRMDPAIVRDASTSSATPGSAAWAHLLDEIMAVLQFRSEMLEALKSKA